MKKLIQEILCHLEQVSPDQLLQRAKADISSGVREQQAFWGSCTRREGFEQGLQGLLAHPAVRVCKAGMLAMVMTKRS